MLHKFEFVTGEIPGLEWQERSHCMEISRPGKELSFTLWEMLGFKPARDSIGSMHFTTGTLATVWGKGQERGARTDEGRPVRSPSPRPGGRWW